MEAEGQRSGRNYFADEAQMPQLFDYLWLWFLRLSKRRGSGFGPAPLTHTGLRDFFTLIRIRPTPWEIEQIEQLDDLWLKIQAEKSKAATT